MDNFVDEFSRFSDISYVVVFTQLGVSLLVAVTLTVVLGFIGGGNRSPAATRLRYSVLIFPLVGCVAGYFLSNIVIITMTGLALLGILALLCIVTRSSDFLRCALAFGIGCLSGLGYFTSAVLVFLAGSAILTLMGRKTRPTRALSS